jgi:transposase
MMDEFIKRLDTNLKYEKDETVGDTCYLYVTSARKKLICSKCGQSSSRVHSTYTRSFQDLPIQDKKVIVVIKNRKMFCDNPDCKNTTFAETFSFIPPKGKKSKRLIEKIIDISLNVSSVTASSLLSGGVANIGKSTICAMLKKTKSQVYERKR